MSLSSASVSENSIDNLVSSIGTSLINDSLEEYAGPNVANGFSERLLSLSNPLIMIR